MQIQVVVRDKFFQGHTQQLLDTNRLNELSTGYSPVNIPQVIQLNQSSYSNSVTNSNQISAEKRKEYYEQLNDQDYQFQKDSTNQVSDKIFVLEREVSDLHVKYKFLLDQCEQKSNIADQNVNDPEKDHYLHQIRMEVSLIADSLLSKESLLNDLKSQQSSHVQIIDGKEQKQNFDSEMFGSQQQMSEISQINAYHNMSQNQSGNTINNLSSSLRNHN
eukprot:403334367